MADRPGVRALVFRRFSSPAREELQLLDFVHDPNAQPIDEFVDGVNPETFPLPLDVFRLVFKPRECDFKNLKYWLSVPCAHGIADLRLDLSPGEDEPSKFNFRIPSRSQLLRVSIRGCLVSPALIESDGFRLVERVYIERASFNEFVYKSIILSIPSVTVLDIRHSTDLYELSGEVVGLTSLVLVDCNHISEISLSSGVIERIFISTLTVNKFDMGQAPRFLFDAYMNWRITPGGLDHMDGNRRRMLSLFRYIRVLTLGRHPLELLASPHRFMPEEPLLQCRRVEFRHLEELQLLKPENGVETICGFFHFVNCPRMKRLFIEFNGRCLPDDDGDRPFEAELNELVRVKLKNVHGNLEENWLAGMILEKAVALRSMFLIACPKHGDNTYNHAAIETFLGTVKVSPGAVVRSYQTDTTDFHPTHRTGNGPEREL